MNEPDWQAATELILEFESFRPYPYDDASPNRRWYRGMAVRGTLTIGYGETNEAIVMSYVDSGREMSEKEAWDRFQLVVPRYWRDTAKYFTTELNPNQCAALTSLSYNAGGAGIKMHAPRLLAAINERRFDDAVALWKESIIMRGTIFEAGLRRRRQAEAALFARPWSGPAPDPWTDLFVPVLVG